MGEFAYIYVKKHLSKQEADKNALSIGTKGDGVISNSYRNDSSACILC